MHASEEVTWFVVRALGESSAADGQHKFVLEKAVDFCHNGYVEHDYMHYGIQLKLSVVRLVKITRWMLGKQADPRKKSDDRQ